MGLQGRLGIDQDGGRTVRSAFASEWKLSNHHPDRTIKTGEMLSNTRKAKKLTTPEPIELKKNTMASSDGRQLFTGSLAETLA